MTRQLTKRNGAKPIYQGENSYQVRVTLGRDPISGQIVIKYLTHHGDEASAIAFRDRILSVARSAHQAIAAGQSDTKGKTLLQVMLAKDESLPLRERSAVTPAPTDVPWSARPLSHFLEQVWLPGIKANVAGKTFERYEGLIKRNIVPQLGAVLLGDLTRSAIVDAYARASESGRHDGKGGLSPRTVLHMHRVLRLALDDAQARDLIPSNPAAGKKIAPKAKSEIGDVLDENELLKLLAISAKSDVHMPVHLAATTGLRLGEVLGLRWRDIDRDAGKVHVRQTVQRVGRQVIIKPTPKTKASRRTILLDANTTKLLNAHWKQQHELRVQLGAGRDQNALAFSDIEGRPLCPVGFTKRFSRLVKLSGVTRISFHGLRHTHATQLLARGVNPKVVAERLGHQNVRITLDVYGHVMPSMQEQVVDVLNAWAKN